MFIHFAFSSEKGDTELQTCKLIELILDKRRLLFRKNPEFIPVINAQFMDSNIQPIHVNNFQKGEDFVQLDVTSETDNLPYLFQYLREDIKIICFICTSFDELKNSNHIEEYGKIGLIFDEIFLKDNSIKEVHYYTEESLISDSLIINWNRNYARRSNLSNCQMLEKRKLELEILTYRKPAKLFKSLFESKIIVIGGQNEGLMQTYGRYPLGYNFKNEKEWRIISKSNNDYLCFKEEALKSIIVPDINSKTNIENYLNINWLHTPEIFVSTK